ncbi:glycosyltransferase family 2 protein [Pedobacter chitinilyticus]|uniref:glycosyltransferase family 2 protein n=1 Tax=Pedobacter chitinilyticus TaxID=2233776 RepID=UPI0013C4F070|nr:glycosyltransferase family 2 protein [Pedobacter chitinilyticus]
MKISIITINYNNAAGLEKTVNSVIDQTYEFIEYIIIDGGSDDGSTDVLAKYQNKIAYSISERDNGIYHAMNKGIHKSSGDYLLFLNSGDILFKSNSIEDAVKQGFDCDLVSGNMLCDNDGIKRDWIPDDKLDFALFYHNTIPHPSTFIKRTLFDLVGLYDEALSIVSDWKFFFLAYCKFNCSYKHIDVFIAEFMEDGISSNPLYRPKMKKEQEDVISENFAAFVPYYEELLDARKKLRKLRYTIKIKKFFGIR